MIDNMFIWDSCFNVQGKEHLSVTRFQRSCSPRNTRQGRSGSLAKVSQAFVDHQFREGEGLIVSQQHPEAGKQRGFLIKLLESSSLIIANQASEYQITINCVNAEAQ